MKCDWCGEEIAGKIHADENIIDGEYCSSSCLVEASVFEAKGDILLNSMSNFQNEF